MSRLKQHNQIGNFFYYDANIIDDVTITGDLSINDGSVDAIKFFNDNNVATGPDIQFDSDALIAAKGSLYLNIDSDNNSTNAALIIGKDASTSSATALMRIQEDGSVGIGVTPSGSILEVALSGAGGNLRVTTPGGNSGVVFGSSNRQMMISNDAGMHIVAGTGTSTPALTSGLTVKNGGDVGIGATSPSAKLDVVGDIKATATATGSLEQVLQLGVSDAAADYLRVINATTTANRFSPTLDGHCESNTLPSLLALASTPNANDTGTSPLIQIQARRGDLSSGSALTARNILSIRNYTTALIDIDVNGRVGIGTASPTAVLDIAASSTSRASMRIRNGAAPTSPNDGEMWYDGTNLKFRAGATTRTITWT